MADNQATYRDPTENIFPADYDESKIDPRVRIRTKAVREKMYGVDVRGAMAQAEEISSVVSTEANELAEKTSERQDELEERYDRQIAGNTDISEVIDARDSNVSGVSFITLKRRLDFADSVLFKNVPSGFKIIIEHDSEYQPDIHVTSYEDAIGTEKDGLEESGHFGGATITNVPTQLRYDRKKAYIEMPIFYALDGEIIIPEKDILLIISGNKKLCFKIFGASITKGYFDDVDKTEIVRVPKNLSLTVLDDDTIKLIWNRGNL